MRSDGLGQVSDSLGPKISLNDMQPILKASTYHHSAIQPHPATPVSPRDPAIYRPSWLCLKSVDFDSKGPVN